MDRLAKMTAFAKVAETGSFTKAARALRMSPTIISKHARELEEALAVRLLNRTTRHVSLTEIGSIYYEHCAAPEYLARHGTPATPEDLTTHNCLVVNNAQLGAPWSFTGADGATHTVKVSGNFRTNSAAAGLEAALQGQGLALQPDFLVEQALRDGQMARVLPDYATPRLTFRMVYPPGRHLTAKLRAFIDFLVANLAS